MGYLRYSAAEKRRMLREWQRSDESLAEFCRAHGVSAGSLMRWRQELEVEADLAPNGAQPVKFVEVDVAGRRESGAASPVLAAELVLPGGMILRVFSALPPC
jgi:transposase-like protein